MIFFVIKPYCKHYYCAVMSQATQMPLYWSSRILIVNKWEGVYSKSIPDGSSVESSQFNDAK